MPAAAAPASSPRAAAEETPPPFLDGDARRVARGPQPPWIVAGLGAMCAYHAIVLPAVFVLGPVTISDRLGGPGRVGGGRRGVRHRLDPRRPRAPALPARGTRCSWPASRSIGASCQAAVYGSGLGLVAMCVLQCAAGVGVTLFFTLWEVSLQEHVPGEALSRVTLVRLPLGDRADAGRHGASPARSRRRVGTQATLLAMSAVGRRVRAGVPRGAGGARPAAAPRRRRSRRGRVGLAARRPAERPGGPLRDACFGPVTRYGVTGQGFGMSPLLKLLIRVGRR